MIKLKRAYDQPTKQDGFRILVDRLWPRGLRKEDADLDSWMKEVAPTDELRKWFQHDPEKWDEFCRRYRRELDGKKDAIDFLRDKCNEKTLTLVYAAKDAEHNNAVALKDYLSHTAVDRS